MARPTGRPVRDELLTATRELIQSVGVGGFSYADLAERIGIKAPSIHHHFRRKEDLVAEVARLYRSEFAANVHAIDNPNVVDRLRSYADLFAATAANDMMCLCGAVTAEWVTAGAGPQAEVEGFFEDQVGWLTEQVAAGVDSGELRAGLDPLATAETVLATLEGAILMSRASTRDPVAVTSTLILDLLAPRDDG